MPVCALAPTGKAHHTPVEFLQNEKLMPFVWISESVALMNISLKLTWLNRSSQESSFQHPCLTGTAGTEQRLLFSGHSQLLWDTATPKCSGECPCAAIFCSKERLATTPEWENESNRAEWRTSKAEGNKGTGQLVWTKFDFLPVFYMYSEYENSYELPHTYF